jgi:hypothetical protein
MYLLYAIEERCNDRRFFNPKETHLYGCNVGLIPKMLLASMKGKTDHDDPHPWSYNVAEQLSVLGFSDSAIVIDLKPGQSRENLSLYELVDIWGVSHGGWTPMMFHLRSLFSDDDPRKYDRNDFTKNDYRSLFPCVSFIYLNGGLSAGRLNGPWTPPPRSNTNGPLLYDDVFKYFISNLRRKVPELF